MRGSVTVLLGPRSAAGLAPRGVETKRVPLLSAGFHAASGFKHLRCCSSWGSIDIDGKRVADLDSFLPDMNDIEVRELRYFIAVAEELNFTRAAERLGIAQPPLSKAVSVLERKIGVALLRRTTRLVALTPAGAELLEQGRIALEAVTAAGLRAARAGKKKAELVVAVKPGGDGGLLRKIVTVYQRDAQLPRARIVAGGWGEQLEMLRSGKRTLLFSALRSTREALTSRCCSPSQGVPCSPAFILSPNGDA
jgi:DNA-binding transcriptional LysR family regulator